MDPVPSRPSTSDQVLLAGPMEGAGEWKVSPPASEVVAVAVVVLPWSPLVETAGPVQVVPDATRETRVVDHRLDPKWVAVAP